MSPFGYGPPPKPEVLQTAEYVRIVLQSRVWLSAEAIDKPRRCPHQKAEDPAKPREPRGQFFFIISEMAFRNNRPEIMRASGSERADGELS